MEDLLDALLVKTAVAAVGDEVPQKRDLVDRPAFVGDRNACNIGLTRHRTERAEGVCVPRGADVARLAADQLQKRGIGFKDVDRVVVANRQPVKQSAGHRAHLRRGSAGRVKLHHDIGPEARGDVLPEAARHFLGAADRRHRIRARIQLQRLGFDDRRRGGGHEQFGPGRLRHTLRIEPGKFVQAPDVGSPKVMVADGFAPERAGNRLQELGIVPVLVERFLAEQGVLGFGHQNGHGGLAKKEGKEKPTRRF